jgi:hypothetical protein
VLIWLIFPCAIWATPADSGRVKTANSDTLFIMVLPRGHDPLARLEEDPDLRACATAIEGVLLSYGFAVIDPQSSEAIDSRLRAQEILIGDDRTKSDSRRSSPFPDRISYQAQADLIVRFRHRAVSSDGKSGVRIDFTTESTRRSLSIDPVRIKGFISPEETHFEFLTRVCRDAAAELACRLWKRWHTSVAQPSDRLRVVFRLPAGLSEDERERVQDALVDFLGEETSVAKLNIITSLTIDFTLYLPEQSGPMTVWLKNFRDRLNRRLADLQSSGKIRHLLQLGQEVISEKVWFVLIEEGEGR